jgi:transcriptional regulator with XRE-family HTH domain
MNESGSFGGWVKQRRIHLGFTQKHLGQLVGYSEPMIRKIESGERQPTRSGAELLAEHLKIDPKAVEEFIKAATERPPPASAEYLHLIDLLPSASAPLRLQTAEGRIIAPSDSVQVREPVTISFTVRNDGPYPIKIMRLRAGGRIHRTCRDDIKTKWTGLPMEFPVTRSILLSPGDQYTYQQKREFFEPGNHFVEPVWQDEKNNWHGFWPTVCIDFVVIPSPETPS